ncbi:MAG: hypothetical protein VW778_10530 [Betaproteobacteria bacterium]
MPQSIDWKKEIKAISPFIGGKGGVIRIEYHGLGCAQNNFNSLIKHWHAEGESPNFSIRIDREFFTTHTLEDTLHEFEKKLKIGSRFENFDQDIKILSGNHVGGNATFNLQNVHFDGNSFDASHRRRERIKAILEALALFLTTGRCMVVAQHHSPSEQNYFWRNFWSDGLSELVGDGLLLVHFQDKDLDIRVHEYAPMPDVVLQLPRDLQSDDRAADAYDDLYDLFKSKGLSNDGASEAASTILALSTASVASVHDNLAMKLIHMASRT